MAEGYKSPLPDNMQTRTAGDDDVTLPKIQGPGKGQSSTDKAAAAQIKETDSPYIRLSKQGGHKDLLKIELPVIVNKSKPVPYPRNQWYYHLDNAKEDALEKTTTDYQQDQHGFCEDSTLPDFRKSSKSYKGNQMQSSKNMLKMDLPAVVQKPEPVPYPRNEWYYYLDNAKEDELKKTITNYQPNHEMLLHGLDFDQSSQGVDIPTYGLRKVMPDKPLFNKPKVGNSNNSAIPRVYGAMAAEEGGGQMDKIMAHSYSQDWQDQSKAHRQRLQASITKSLKSRSEYKDRYGPAIQVWQRAGQRHAAVKSKYRLPATKPGQQLEQLPQPDATKAAVGGKQQGERFTLSKFKKVGPKVNTGRKNIH